MSHVPIPFEQLVMDRDLLKQHINEYHLTWFDGGVTTGWADLIVDFRAFSRPEAKVLRWVKHWDCGEFSGTENNVLRQASAHVSDKLSVRGGNVSFLQYDVGGEDFDLVQTMGDKKNILSPVRFNAVMDWECSKHGIIYQYQARQMRTSVTPQRLKLFGFNSPYNKRGTWSTSGEGKDAFAAMQHAVTWLRNLKIRARERPWKLMDATSFNAYWDCACARDKRAKCDLVHPR